MSDAVNSQTQIQTVRTRFAPSPTGDLHIGSARTALFSYLAARHSNGVFILRIEDTDLERSNESSVKAIFDGMAWLNLNYDEGPFFQTKRFERYKEVAEELVKKNQAYRCNCSKERLEKLREDQMSKGEKPRYDHHCRELNLEKDQTQNSAQVIRFKNPLEGHVSWDDLVRGPISFSNHELDDMIIWRSDHSPTYNFSVVVDDFDMKITHVVRGDDHVNNTPRQINIFKALNFPCPNFAHVSMILGEDGKKLSKRHGATSVVDYREQGYFPEALLNYLVRLGWSHGDQEIFSPEEMIKYFNLTGVNAAPAAMNVSKLNWVNQQYLKNSPIEKIMPEIQYHFDKAGLDLSLSNGPEIKNLIPLLADRVHTLVELVGSARYFYQEFEAIDPAAAAKFLKPESKGPLELVLNKLKNLDSDSWNSELIHKAIHDVAEELAIGMGKIGMPLRVAVTGTSQSPAIEETVKLIGKERVLKRIERAIKLLG